MQKFCSHTPAQRKSIFLCRKVCIFTENKKEIPLVLIELHIHVPVLVRAMMMVPPTVVQSSSPSNFIFHQLRKKAPYFVFYSLNHTLGKLTFLCHFTHKKKTSSLPINQLYLIPYIPLFRLVSYSLPFAPLALCCSIIYANKLIHLHKYQ